MATPPEPFTSNVLAEMARHRLNQSQAAAHMGISRPALNNRLRGRTPFTLGDVTKLAELLETTPSALLQASAMAVPA